ncbi:MAG: hypothetical protein AAGK78_07775, partial [Planctomycetota bacterium]
WLALAIWFGGGVFIAIAAPIIFRTVRDADPTLPRVLSVNLDTQHATLLGGEIVSKLLTGLGKITVACAIAMFLALAGMWGVAILESADLDRSVDTGALLVQTVLFVAATVVAFYSAFNVRQKAQQSRELYIADADDPEQAEQLQDSFERAQNETVMLLQIEVFVLLGLVAFSALN